MKTFIVFLALLLLGACANKSRQAPESYDFGISHAAAPPAGQDVFLSEVNAADWLDTTDMLYRLEFRNPRILQPYAASRWAGAPAAMLAIRLRQSVGNGTSVRGRQARCVMTLYLSEFSHVLSTEHTSRAVLHMRATLTDTSSTERALSREFRLEKPAPSADAAGAAVAFSGIVEAVAAELNAWIETGNCKI